MELSSKERLECLLRGESIDTVPVSTRIYKSFIYEYFNSRDVDLIEGAVEIYKHFGMDIIDWNGTPGFEFDDFNLEDENWKPTTRKEVEGNTTKDITIVQTPEGTLQRTISSTPTGKWEEECAVTEWPIKTEEDFELMVKYQPPVPRIDNSCITRAIECIGNDGLCCPSFHGPFNIIVYCYRKLDDLLVDMIANPDFYNRMMEYFLDRLFKYVQQYIEPKPTMFDIGANIANGQLINPDLFAEMIMPYENLLVDFIHDQGIAALYHQCGYAKNHFDIFPQLHHKLWGYAAPPPYGDTILSEAMEKLSPDMIIWGHVDQIDFLRKASTQEIDERVHEILETIKPRGNFILGTTDYMEVETPYENIQAFVDAGRKYGKY